MSPSVNQAEAKSGASSVACSSRSAAAARSPLQLQIARKIEPPVGHQVAGGQEQARGMLTDQSLGRVGSATCIGSDLGLGQDTAASRRALDHEGGRDAERAYITNMRPQDILLPAPAGLCCKPGGFHIDPVRPVERAVITHGHSDHARPGHGAVLATQETLDMMRLRYGDNFAGSTQAIAYGEEIRLGDVRIKFHPAGHVLGSAQIAVTCKDTCIVASGDYKDAPDPTCTPFEVVPLRRLHHRGHLRPAGVPSRRRGGRGEASCWLRWRCFRSARIWSAPIRSARRSA